MTRVTVSGVWEDKGKCVTCNGFCGLGGGWGREKVSRVTVSGVCGEGQGKTVSRVTVSVVCEGVVQGKGVTCNGF